MPGRMSASLPLRMVSPTERPTAARTNSWENRKEVLAGVADDFIDKPLEEADLFQKIHDHLGVEYLYAEEPAAATSEEAAEITPESVAGLPHDLIHPMREAALTADVDQLLAKIQEVEARDPRIAQGLRRLAEQFEYQKLLDLFGSGVDPANPVSPDSPDGSTDLA